MKRVSFLTLMKEAVKTLRQTFCGGGSNPHSSPTRLVFVIISFSYERRKLSSISATCWD